MKKDYSDEGFLTTEQVAIIFGRANITVHKWIERKEIKPAMKTGFLNLFYIKDILKLADKENLFITNPPPAFFTIAVNSIKKKSKLKRKEAFFMG